MSICMKRPSTAPSATLSWPGQTVTWLVLCAHLLSPYADRLIAAGAEPPSTTPRARSEPPLVRTPSEVSVNRTVPKSSLPPIRPIFSATPTDQEIFRARVFAEPLVPTGPTTSEENRALAEALLTFLERGANDDVAPVTQFLQR